MGRWKAHHFVAFGEESKIIVMVGAVGTLGTTDFSEILLKMAENRGDMGIFWKMSGPKCDIE